MKSINKITVDGQKLEFREQVVTGREILLKAGKEPDCYSLYQILKGCDFTKIDLDEKVDIGLPGNEVFETKDPETFRYTVDGEPELTDQKEMIPDQILEAAGISAKDHYLVQVMKDGSKKVYAWEPETAIKMVCGGMTFESAKWHDVVNIEEYGKQCKEVPPARVYLVLVDKKTFKWERPTITGRQIVEQSGKTPANDFEALKFTSNQPKPQLLGDDEVVDLTQKCLVRFITAPKRVDDGRELRKQFTLPAADVEFLNSLGLRWETLTNENFWLIIHDYPIPVGYNTPTAQLALMIPAQYDAVQIDMAYFFPALVKVSARPISAVTPLVLDGKVFQQWSRHRKPGQWQPGVDNICTHLAFVDQWLLNDLNR